jgi:hypothetical protein
MDLVTPEVAADKLIPALLLIFVGLVIGIVFLIRFNKEKSKLKTGLVLFGSVICLVLLFFIINSGGIKYLSQHSRQVFKEPPYKFTDFKYFTIEYGDGDSLVNKYNSQTGDYQYLNKRDSLIKTTLRLTQNDLLYLHRKAAELGFWDFPAKELNNDTTILKGRKPPRYLIEFNYQQRSKKVLFNAAFDTDEQLKEANEHLVDEIMHVLAEAERRYKN